MHRIHYAGDVVLTGSAIADALLQYAAALARTEASETVTFPARREDGSIHEVTVLVGPASQLIAETTDDHGDEIVDDELVASLSSKTAALAQPHALPVSESDDDATSWAELELPDA